MLLITVTFLAGATWGPTVSTQSMPSLESCRVAMVSVAQSINEAAKSNTNGPVGIENYDDGGLKIIAGVNQRVLSIIKCS
jgi:hypothetical protein